VGTVLPAHRVAAIGPQHRRAAVGIPIRLRLRAVADTTIRRHPPAAAETTLIMLRVAAAGTIGRRVLQAVDTIRRVARPAAITITEWRKASFTPVPCGLGAIIREGDRPFFVTKGEIFSSSRIVISAPQHATRLLCAPSPLDSCTAVFL
jgi:hypothetical protein